MEPLTPEEIERLEALRPLSLAAARGDVTTIQNIALAPDTTEWLLARAIHTLRCMETTEAGQALRLVLAEVTASRLQNSLIDRSDDSDV